MSDSQDEAELYSTLKDLNDPNNPNSPLSGAKTYQQNATASTTDPQSSALFQALLKQTMQQGQQSSGYAPIMQGLMQMFQQGGGAGASWSPGVASASYSMGGSD